MHLQDEAVLSYRLYFFNLSTNNHTKKKIDKKENNEINLLFIYGFLNYI